MEVCRIVNVITSREQSAVGSSIMLVRLRLTMHICESSHQTSERKCSGLQHVKIWRTFSFMLPKIAYSEILHESLLLSNCPLIYKGYWNSCWAWPSLPPLSSVSSMHSTIGTHYPDRPFQVIYFNLKSWECCFRQRSLFVMLRPRTACHPVEVRSQNQDQIPLIQVRTVSHLIDYDSSHDF